MARDMSSIPVIPHQPLDNKRMEYIVLRET